MADLGLADPLPILPRGPLDGVLRPPGSRSITNRALIAAALASGTSSLVGATESDDTLAMAGGLTALGVSIERGPEAWSVTGTGGALRASGPLDVNASGTTARFLTAVATLATGASLLDGTKRLRERPIQELVDALGHLGAKLRVVGQKGGPPVQIDGGGLTGGTVEIDASRSSQFVSGLLLAGPCAQEAVTLTLAGGKLVSRPFLELTLQVMADFGVAVDWNGKDRLHIPAEAAYHACEFQVEADSQAAVYPFCAAAIVGGSVLVQGIPADSEQTEIRLLPILEKMGCRVERRADGIRVERPVDQPLRGVEVDGNSFPDAVLALAVVALYADEPTTVRGLGHLPLKETNRLEALRNEIRRLGAGAEIGEDWIRVEPAPLRPAVIETYDDHRMAMSFALAGLRTPGVEIRDPGCVAKTWPGFFEALDRL